MVVMQYSTCRVNIVTEQQHHANLILASHKLALAYGAISKAATTL